MNISILSLLFQGIPENIAIVTLAFVVAKIPLNWRKIAGIGIVLALMAYLVRLLSVPFGIHSILIIIILFIFLMKLSKRDVSLSLIASLVSFLALALFEVAAMSLLLSLFKIAPEELYTHDLLRIALGEPQVILLFITAFLVQRFYMKGRNQ